MQVPIATYRIQFNPFFTFQSALGIVPYLFELGISTVYASPIFKAKKGSTHGYDVIDHNQLNPEFGQYDDFERLVSELKSRAMWWLQDIVPNHMAYDSQNHMLMDVLENGPCSEYFNFFDIDWSHPYGSLNGRLLAPFLGKFYAESLEDGEIRLKYDEGGLSINYYDLKLPIKLKSYKEVFMRNIKVFEEKFGENNPDLVKFLGVLHFFENLSEARNDDSQYDQVAHAKAMLWLLYTGTADIRKFMDESVEVFNGNKNDTASFDNIDRLLSDQPFRLSFWKVAAEEINYRRFFNINALISLRVEEEKVFNHIHDFVFRLIKEEKISGLRVDHIDGLFDPGAYLVKLRERIGPVYTVVEKILGHDEELPEFWPAEGTTGYDFLNYLNGVFCDKDSEKDFARIYYKFTGLYLPVEEISCDKKRLIIGKHMAGTIDNLARFMKGITEKDRYGRDITLYGLKRALVEIMVFFPVYRSYIDQENFRDADKQYIKEAVNKARVKNPGLTYEFSFIEKFLLFDIGPHFTNDEKATLRNFIMRFQQFTAPLMAKGFEDTALYNYNKLISLNEVGGNPARFGVSVEEFYDFNKKRLARFQNSLNASSTHDSKRGEDVRARINVLSELPGEWRDYLRSWSRLNRPKKKTKDNMRMPDANDEYFLYQTLIGAFPFYEAEFQDFKDRVKAYIIKAVREAKVHTAWIKPDTEYEEACISFIEKILTHCEKNRFLGEFLEFQRKIAFYGVFNSLSQTLIKITSPGAPDFYQGTELWDLNLVDPDNRRAVDFQKRISLLTSIKKKAQENIYALLEELLCSVENGGVKLFLVYQALKLRRERIELFQRGNFIPLKTGGRFKDCIIAYARNYEGGWALTIVPRFLTRLVKEGERPLGEKVWHDTCILLPEGLPSFWKDAISGTAIEGVNRLSAACIFKSLPAALLVNN